MVTNPIRYVLPWLTVVATGFFSIAYPANPYQQRFLTQCDSFDPHGAPQAAAENDLGHPN